jgi:hypothetical protein
MVPFQLKNPSKLIEVKNMFSNCPKIHRESVFQFVSSLPPELKENFPEYSPTSILPPSIKETAPHPSMKETVPPPPSMKETAPPPPPPSMKETAPPPPPSMEEIVALRLDQDRPGYSFARPLTLVSPFVAGENLPDGISMNIPSGVERYNPSIMDIEYFNPQLDLAEDFTENLSEYEHTLLKQYIGTRCYHEAVDCYVGNRLINYLLTIHPEIISKYHEFQYPIPIATYSEESPVIFKQRYMTLDKLLVILRGFRDLNVLVKSFPPLIETMYPNGLYLYRGKPYRRDCELLTIGQTFVTSTLISTSINSEVAAKDFARFVNTKYKNSLGKVVTNYLTFIWRIKMPLNYPGAFFNLDFEMEGLLPIGTELRYLGCYVQGIGPNNIYTSDIDTPYIPNTRNKVKGILICEFEIVRIIPTKLLLQDLVSVVEKDFRDGNTRIYAEDLTVPSEYMNVLDSIKKPVLPDEAFGKKRKRIRKTKSRKTKRRSNSKLLKRKTKKH